MKHKRLILCTLTLWVGFAASAQVSIYGDDGVVSGWMGTIVRSWGANYGVSYYWDGTQPYLDVVCNSPYGLFRLPMPKEINIKDMYVDQQYDILYFCGTTASPQYAITTGEGVLGYLKLNDIIAPAPSNVSIEWVTISEVSVLTKLAEYNNSGLPQVVAIGVYYQINVPYLTSQYYFVECPDASSPATLVNTQISHLSSDERYYDIMLTDKFVVCFGYNTDPTIDAICYRKTLKANLYDPMLDTVHYFLGGNDAFSVTHTTAISKDSIITSYLYADDSGSFHTRIRTIDVSNDIMTHSQQYHQFDKMDPTDIVFIPADNSVVLMQDFTLYGLFNSNFVYIDPHPTSLYLATLEFLPGISFLSMTMHDSHYYLAGLGASWFLKDKLVPPTSSPNPGCPKADMIVLKIIKNKVHQCFFYPTYQPPCTCNNYNDTPITQSPSLNLNCRNY